MPRYGETVYPLWDAHTLPVYAACGQVVRELQSAAKPCSCFALLSRHMRSTVEEDQSQGAPTAAWCCERGTCSRLHNPPALGPLSKQESTSGKQILSKLQQKMQSSAAKSGLQPQSNKQTSLNDSGSERIPSEVLRLYLCRTL